MNATVDDLVSTIGEQTVELRLLRNALSELQLELSKVKEEFNACKTKNDKKEK
ncbi:MAG: hypothetical protein QQN63_14310 [Nitrosopumilus sp.]